jgi:hypothetical protein
VSHPAHWKIELAVRGARLHDSVRQRKEFSRLGMRHDAPRSLDVVLPDDVGVDVPIDERHTASSPFLIGVDGTRFVLRRGSEEEDAPVPVRLVPPPRFYERLTSRGTPMRDIGIVRGGYLIVGPGSRCGFSVQGSPCRFCVEGARIPERDPVPVGDVVEVVRAAFDEGKVQLVYFNTSMFDAEDGGIAFLAPYIEAVRNHFDTLVAAQVHPPRTDRWIDRTYAMGVDGLSYNLEIFDPEVLNRHCIGRARYVGRERYLEALAYAARIFPSGTVWSDLAIGLEPSASTIAGIDAFLGMGVVPTISIPRGEQALPAMTEVAPVLAHLYRAGRKSGINMSWVRDLTLAIAPLEARHFAGDGARLAVAGQQLTRWRLGALAARGFARLRRRLRVHRVTESFGSAHAS